MGAALLQADATSKKALKAALEEVQGGPCVFDKNLNPTEYCLHPISMISCVCNELEWHYHSCTGETAMGVWAVKKYRPYLAGVTFTWITDCSGVRHVFESNLVPTHKIQRWIHNHSQTVANDG